MNNYIKVYPYSLDEDHIITLFSTVSIKNTHFGFFISFKNIPSYHVVEEDLIKLVESLVIVKNRYFVEVGIIEYSVTQLNDISNILNRVREQIEVHLLYKESFIEYIRPYKSKTKDILIYDENEKVIENNVDYLNKLNFKIETSENIKNFEIDKEDMDSLMHSFLSHYGRELIEIILNDTYVKIYIKKNPEFIDVSMFYKFILGGYNIILIDLEKVSTKNINEIPEIVDSIKNLSVNIYVINVVHKNVIDKYTRYGIKIINDESEILNEKHKININLNSIEKYNQMQGKKVLKAVISTFEWFTSVQYKIEKASLIRVNKDNITSNITPDTFLLFGKISGKLNMNVIIAIDTNLYYEKLNDILESNNIKDISNTLFQAIIMKLGIYMYNNSHKLYSNVYFMKYNENLLLKLLNGVKSIKVNLANNEDKFTVFITG